jgi:hypothetical protein
MSIAFVTAINDNYIELFFDLYRSMGPFREQLHVIDIGLSKKSSDFLKGIPVFIESADSILQGKLLSFDQSYFKAMYLRPMLPALIPADTIFWIDADCWIQDITALDTYINASKTKDHFIICSMVDPDYPRCISDYFSYMETYKKVHADLFGDKCALYLFGKAIFSSGVFCAKRTSPVWRLWEKEVKRIYEDVKPSGDLGHIAEQSSLCKVLHETGLYHVLTSDHNFHCHCSDVIRDNGNVIIQPSGRKPKIVHLSEYKNRSREYAQRRLRFESSE